MRLFKWICWLRGFHRSSYALTRFDPSEILGESGNLHGTLFPCETCGHIHPEGSYKKAYLKLEWREEVGIVNSIAPSADSFTNNAGLN